MLALIRCTTWGNGGGAVDRSLRSLLGLTLVVILLVGTAGCMAGTGKYNEERKASLRVGLFNGLISPVTPVILLFAGAQR
jgi:hypothetical protein